jgi:predicted ATPase
LNRVMSSAAVAFEGRCKELEFLLARLSAALIGEGGVVAIAGEAGIGKTRLVGEFKKIGDQVGCTAFIGMCIAGPPSSYLPFRDMLPRGVITEALRGGVGGTIEGDHFPFLMLDMIRKMSRDRTLIIILEDMQWADEDSVSLLHFLAKRIEGLKVLIVCTYRPKEILATGKDQTHPFYDTLQEMRRECLCEEIVLGPLGEKELGKIAENILGGPFEPTSLQRLLDSTGSNVLYFIETLMSMTSEGGILQDNGIWMMKTGAEIPLNESVRQTVLGQLDILTRSERRLLELASVIGVSFNYSLIADVIELEPMKVSELFDNIETRTDLVRDVGDGYCFRDVITRDIIRAQVSPMRQKEFLKAANKPYDHQR